MGCARQPYPKCDKTTSRGTSEQYFTTTSVWSRAAYAPTRSPPSGGTNQVADHEYEHDHNPSASAFPIWEVVTSALIALGCIIMGVLCATTAKLSRVEPKPDDIESQGDQNKVTAETAPPPDFHNEKLALASQASPRPSIGTTRTPSSRSSLRTSSSTGSPRRVAPPHRIRAPRTDGERSRSLPPRPRDNAGKDSRRTTRSCSPVSNQSGG